MTWFLALSARVPLLKNEETLRMIRAAGFPYLQDQSDRQRVIDELTEENQRWEYGPSARRTLGLAKDAEAFIDSQWNMLRMRI